MKNCGKLSCSDESQSTELKGASRTPALSPIKHQWDMVEEENHIVDVMMLTCQYGSEVFPKLSESMQQIVNAVLRAKCVCVCLGNTL